ncbi:MAG: hypothetical protein RL352_266 [Actinomycetota bacterium]|nr:MBL fold metallo-hydrolase [Actinomycetota bacterium]
MLIGFWGANGTVTGSRTIVDTGGARVLVDCGLFQGDREVRARNREDFPVDPSSIDAVVLTHAHIDHSGYLPVLVRDGFRGPVWCTPGTADICQLVLPDAAHLEEEEASYANKHRTSRHHPAIPLFTARDAHDALALLRPVPFVNTIKTVGDVRLTFFQAGHIIGASTVQLHDSDVRITFSGDVGRAHARVMRPPAPLQPTDVLVMESTYGDRAHPLDDSRDRLKRITNDTIACGGTLLIPSFAVGRAQEILSLLSDLRVGGEIPDVPVYVNSPMATDATELFLRHRDEHKLTPAQCERMSQHVHYVRTVEASKALTRDESPKIVISASGMATGGRVLRHLAQLAPHPRNTLLFVGYQAFGTRGHAIISRASHVRIFGVAVPVRARVEHLASLSAHADMNELVDWAGHSSSAPVRTYLNHGEVDASVALREMMRQRLGWHVEIPNHGDEVDTSSFMPERKERPPMTELSHA